MFNILSILFLLDSVAALLSLIAGQYLRLGGAEPLVGHDYFRVIMYTLAILMSGYFCELYTADRSLPFTELAARVAVSIMIALFVISALFYVVQEIPFGRGVLSLALLIFGVLQLLIHRACRSLQNGMFGSPWMYANRSFWNILCSINPTSPSLNVVFTPTAFQYAATSSMTGV